MIVQSLKSESLKKTTLHGSRHIWWRPLLVTKLNSTRTRLSLAQSVESSSLGKTNQYNECHYKDSFVPDPDKII